MANKTSEEFQQQAKKMGIEKWHIDSCSMCGYPCCFVFKNDSVFYDNHCYCGGFPVDQRRTWNDVAEQYNMQSNADVIKKYDDFWGFE